MRDLTAFNHRLATTFGAGYVACWDAVAGRFAVDTPTVDGRTVRQYWGWFTDPVTRTPIDADPDTGLHPYRDLDASAQDEIVRNLHRSNIGHTGDGLRDWSQELQAKRTFNADLAKRKRKQRAQTWADLIAEVDIRRPGWLKDHQHGQKVSRG